MKHYHFLLLALITFNINGQVKLKFNNTLDEQIVVKVRHGEISTPIESMSEVFTQTMQANSETPDFIRLRDVRKGQKFVVLGQIGAKGLFKFFESTLLRRNSEHIITMTATMDEVGNDEISYQNLLKAISDTPPENSRKVIPADDAYNTFFGGLSIRDKEGNEIDRIDASVLKAVKNPIQYGNLDKKIEAFFTGSFLTKNNGEVPGIASASIAVNSSRGYKLKYDLNDIGTRVWSGPNGKSIDELFSQLNPIVKNGVVKRYLADTTLTMHQLDHLYLFQSAIISVEKYKSSKTIIDATVPVFLSSSSAFEKEEGGDDTTASTNTVLNIWSKKDVTYLLVQAAKDYLEKQKEIIAIAKSNSEAQKIAEAVIGKNNAITPVEKVSKTAILNNVDKEITKATKKLLKIKF
ncbi:hypothetical protein ABV409_08760 [Flagellimonas sp. DF-77]|uniref:hypothetical protein n=1 Tax=Flagellimonas algarum TaxID=3230298 RepID=UPI0033966F38